MWFIGPTAATSNLLLFPFSTNRYHGCNGCITKFRISFFFVSILEFYKVNQGTALYHYLVNP